MGALHKGHISLVECSAAECDCTIVSIFVNPTQFNQVEDLVHYPRTLEADMAMLSDSPCQAVFLPAVEDIYPCGTAMEKHWDFAGLDVPLEGQFRPGHFDGVAQVVKILLDQVRPDMLFLGQKDYQQFAIIRKMVELEGLPVELCLCPIVREPDGLAMSSRNMRLSEQQRLDALALSQTLFRARERIEALRPENRPRPADICTALEAELKSQPAITLEYFSFVHPLTLQAVEDWVSGSEILVCVAAWAGPVRLIDNIIARVP